MAVLEIEATPSISDTRDTRDTRDTPPKRLINQVFPEAALCSDHFRCCVTDVTCFEGVLATVNNDGHRDDQSTDGLSLWPTASPNLMLHVTQSRKVVIVRGWFVFEMCQMISQINDMSHYVHYAHGSSCGL